MVAITKTSTCRAGEGKRGEETEGTFVGEVFRTRKAVSVTSPSQAEKGLREEEIGTAEITLRMQGEGRREKKGSWVPGTQIRTNELSNT